jgi:uncharacterized glyoxalase superfamily protein PhnB
MNDGRAKTTAAVEDLFPYLCVRDAAAAIAFYERAFGAQELFRLTEPGGRIGHVELKLGPGTLMLAEEFPECGFRAPQDADGRSVTIHLHVADADAMAAQACAAGATMLRKPTDEFYGERSCLLRDPFGHSWMLGHRIEEVTPAEMQRRYDAMFKRG